MKTKHAVVTFLVFIVIAIIIISFAYRNDKAMIRNKVENVDGQIITIEQQYFKISPFKYRSKGQRIYKFTYKVQNQMKTGYVRISNPWFNNKWIFEE